MNWNKCNKKITFLKNTMKNKNKNKMILLLY